jgi:hypothetical protein
MATFRMRPGLGKSDPNRESGQTPRVTQRCRIRESARELSVRDPQAVPKDILHFPARFVVTPADGLYVLEGSSGVRKRLIDFRLLGDRIPTEWVTRILLREEVSIRLFWRSSQKPVQNKAGKGQRHPDARRSFP